MMQQTSESGLWPSFRFDLYIFASHIIYVVKEVTIIQEGGGGRLVKDHALEQ